MILQIKKGKNIQCENEQKTRTDICLKRTYTRNKHAGRAEQRSPLGKCRSNRSELPLLTHQAAEVGSSGNTGELVRVGGTEAVLRCWRECTVVHPFCLQLVIKYNRRGLAILPSRGTREHPQTLHECSQRNLHRNVLSSFTPNSPNWRLPMAGWTDGGDPHHGVSQSSKRE